MIVFEKQYKISPLWLFLNQAKKIISPRKEKGLVRHPVKFQRYLSPCRTYPQKKIHIVCSM